MRAVPRLPPFSKQLGLGDTMGVGQAASPLDALRGVLEPMPDFLRSAQVRPSSQKRSDPGESTQLGLGTSRPALEGRDRWGA